MIIDCDTCVMDGTSACADCIVPVLLAGTLSVATEPAGTLPAGTERRIEVDAEEEEALRNLSKAGLVAPLRLVPRDPGQDAVTG